MRNQFLMCVMGGVLLTLAGCGQNPHVTAADFKAAREHGPGAATTTVTPPANEPYDPNQPGWHGEQHGKGKGEQAPPVPAAGRLENRVVMLPDGTPVLIDIFIPVVVSAPAPEAGTEEAL